ncbi:MAG: hypothetical protein KatS3mg111_2331 [Pirellulaceae bacterium]|nr:MAG: hypothetical protein KatS3mg111_2331 [Pirellulaceae bacterium]
MTGMVKKQIANISLVMAIGAVWYWLRAVDERLGDAAILSGWLLLSAYVGLMLLWIRKRIYARRWGRVAGWLALHRRLGWFAAAVFMMHIGWPIEGRFEQVLAMSFLVVTATGILVSIASRTVPRRLLALPTDYRWEQIPALQRQVAQQAHCQAIASASFDEGATLAEFYHTQLLPFFQGSRSWLYVAWPSGSRRRRLVGQLHQLRRYLGPRGKEVEQTLARLVQQKDDLDYHYALQRRLRVAYAAHVALTWALGMMIAAHVVLALRFQGAW